MHHALEEAVPAIATDMHNEVAAAAAAASHADGEERDDAMWSPVLDVYAACDAVHQTRPPLPDDVPMRIRLLARDMAVGIRQQPQD